MFEKLINNKLLPHLTFIIIMLINHLIQSSNLNHILYIICTSSLYSVYYIFNIYFYSDESKEFKINTLMLKSSIILYSYTLYQNQVIHLLTTLKIADTINFYLLNNFLDPEISIYHTWPVIYYSFYILRLFELSEVPYLLFIIFPFMIKLLEIVILNKALQLLDDFNQTKLISINYIYLSLSWIKQEYLSQQALGYLLYVLIFYYIIKISSIYFQEPTSKNKHSILKYSLIITLSIITIYFTHLLTFAYTILSITITILIVFLKSNYKSSVKYGILIFLSILVLTSIELVLTYNLQVQQIVIRNSYQFFDFYRVLQTNLINRIFGSPLRIVTISFKILITFSIYFLFLLNVKKFFNFSNSPLYLVITTHVILPFSLLFYEYGGEAIFRSILFLAFPMCLSISQIRSPIFNIFKIRSSKRKFRIQILLIFIIILITPFAKFGDYQIEIYQEDEVYIAKYLEKNYNQAMILGGFTIKTFFETNPYFIVEAPFDIKWNSSNNFISNFYFNIKFNNTMANIFFISSPNDIIVMKYYDYDHQEYLSYQTYISNSPNSHLILTHNSINVFLLNNQT